jgi:uncharacterized protein
MKCPSCPDSVLTMADRSGVEIDYCPTCRGVWLDRGELDKIIERASAPAPQPAAAYPPPGDSRYRDDDRPRRRDDDWDDDNDYRYSDRGGPYKKRKKSMLSEIFDF